MTPKEILKKVRRIEIRTSRIVTDALAGQYHSAFKGRGMAFEEVRQYHVGDDVRSIDWNVTARTGEPHIKVFREERELTVLLVVDLSLSQSFGSNRQFKRELVAELSATLAFSAIKNNDNIGLIVFTDRIETFVPPRKGKAHVLRVIRELLALEPQGHGTDIGGALDHLNRVMRRKAVVFLVSDFQDEGYARSLRITNRRHDLIAVDVSDRREAALPNVGLVTLHDRETGRRVLFDTGSRRARADLERLVAERRRERERQFRQIKLDCIEVETGGDFVDPLIRFFRTREGRR